MLQRYNTVYVLGIQVNNSLTDVLRCGIMLVSLLIQLPFFLSSLSDHCRFSLCVARPTTLWFQLTSHTHLHCIHHHYIIIIVMITNFKVRISKNVHVKISYRTIYQYSMIVSYKRYYIGYSMLNIMLLYSWW